MFFFFFFFFFNDTATTEIYTLSLHDALPIFRERVVHLRRQRASGRRSRQSVCASPDDRRPGRGQDRKSTRLNSSHANISYAVFCLKKKTKLTRYDLYINITHGTNFRSQRRRI